MLQLAGAAAVIGPRWFTQNTANEDATSLLEPQRLLELTKEHGGRITSHTELAFLADYTNHTPAEQLLISHERSDAMSVSRSCPPDDARVADLGAQDRWFTALGDDHQPRASAAYREFQGFLADLTVLTDPTHRRNGLACETVFLAAEDALDAGLTPQLRIPSGHLGGSAIAEALDFAVLGMHTTAQVQRRIV